MGNRWTVREGYVEEDKVDANHEKGLDEEGGGEVGAEPVVNPVHAISYQGLKRRRGLGRGEKEREAHT